MARKNDSFTCECRTCGEEITMYHFKEGWFPVNHAHCRYCEQLITWTNNLPFDLNGARHLCKKART